MEKKKGYVFKDLVIIHQEFVAFLNFAKPKLVILKCLKIICISTLGCTISIVLEFYAYLSFQEKQGNWF